jgi:hypothetical protein
MVKVSRGEFRRAVCRGQLAGCSCVCVASGGEAWIKGGKTLAIKKDGAFGSTYYLEGIV